ncbi:DUF6404 family protein [Chromobacterium sp. IIBBL 290-4]|uniref:DUF6404 family protein n=1 Tax=Chromobacterium sp. IIBBL 290-4 TaxID=2953890 RepID=UPI0020B70C0A|nr:DUF6404 family protein [Chromobacterium sp. IIBBL 290-4]UTH76385.1 DUF6404 family protein [Chromobacterium sp. IIBBL 290-4]
MMKENAAMPSLFGSPAFSQREQALQILARTGIGKANYAPPLFKLLWRLGLNCPPPHFLPFWQATLLLSGFFGPAWAAWMWLFDHFFSWPQPSGLVRLLSMLFTGSLFGLTMALYYAYGRRKYRLPKWEALISSIENPKLE